MDGRLVSLREVPREVTFAAVDGVAPCAQVGFIDSHCHLDRLFKETHYEGSFRGFMAGREHDGELRACVANFCDPGFYTRIQGQIPALLRDSRIFAIIGAHSKRAREFNDEGVSSIRQMVRHRKVVAIGEVGLDYSDSPWDEERAVQKHVFRVMLQLAREFGLPVVVHCREAYVDCFDILQAFLPAEWPIHFHCCKDWGVAEVWLGAYPHAVVGLTPCVSFRHSPALEVARRIPLRRLVIETDAPYFVPAGLRAGFSVPSMAWYVAEVVARVRGLRVREVCGITQDNTVRLYRLPTSVGSGSA